MRYCPCCGNKLAGGFSPGILCKCPRCKDMPNYCVQCGAPVTHPDLIEEHRLSTCTQEVPDRAH